MEARMKLTLNLAACCRQQNQHLNKKIEIQLTEQNRNVERKLSNG